MAYKPSMRRKNEDEEMELDIRPVMNLMVVLIPLLIAGAEWVKLSVIEINVPPAKAADGSGVGDNKNDIKEKQKKLGLTIAISDAGITIGNAGVILSGESGEGPTVGKLEDGKYDYAKLREKLIDLKKKIVGKGFVDENRAVLTASADIEYQTIVTIMDNLQTYTDEESKQVLPLFPEVNFSKVLQ